MSDLLSRTVQSNLGGCQAMHHKPKHSTHHSPADSTDAHAKSHRWLLPVLLVAQLMVILDITAVNIALPHIAMDLKMSGSTISWTITSYSLIFGSLLLFGGLAAIVYGITQAHSAGWTSIQTHVCGIGGLAGLAAFAIYELHIDKPLLRVERIADRAVGGGLVLMLAVAGTIFGLFLLCSLYLQNVLGWGPLTTGLAFVPLALSAGIGSHAAAHVISKHGVRGPLAGSFAVAAVGMFLLSRVGAHGSYLTDVLPGMLVAGVALGVATVSVSMAILTGTRQEENGMISGLNSTGHEIGGTLGIAIFSTIAAGSGAILGPQAASGIGDAFLVAALVASLASVMALALLPRAQHFLAKLALNPQAMPVH